MWRMNIIYKYQCKVFSLVGPTLTMSLHVLTKYLMIKWITN